MISFQHFKGKKEKSLALGLVFPFYEMNLNFLIKHPNVNLNILLVQNLFAGVVRGVNEMHSRELAHCDLKPANIVLNSMYNPKLIDFGHA